MPTKGFMSLSGIEEYLEELAKAEQDVDGAARDVLFEAAQEMQEAMQAEVPVLTARLWMHILIDGPLTNGNYHECEVGIIHKAAFTPKDVAIQANVVEYGTARRAAHPFLRPVFRAKKNVLINAMKKIRDRYGLG